jgi:hypothetical protein
MKPSVITEESDTPIGQMCIDVFGSRWGPFKIAHMGIALEPVTIVRLLSLTLIFAGIVGLKLTSAQ